MILLLYSRISFLYNNFVLLSQDSSRGSYEGDRPPSDESPPPDSGENGQNGTTGATQATRPMSATAACLAAIRRRSGAFDNAEERKQRRRSNMSSGSTSGRNEKPGYLTTILSIK